MKKFELSTVDCEGKKLIVDLSEYDVLSLINTNICKRRNKNVGLKIAKLYLEAGKECQANLIKMGVDINMINTSYEKMKKLLGDIR